MKLIAVLLLICFGTSCTCSTLANRRDLYNEPPATASHSLEPATRTDLPTVEPRPQFR